MLQTIIGTIQDLFGLYQPNKNYQVTLKNICITPEFAATTVGIKKMQSKMNYYQRTGQLLSVIKLNRDFELVDGYTSYLIAKNFGINTVTVQFVK